MEENSALNRVEFRGSFGAMKICDRLNIPVHVAGKVKVLEDADKIIMPGVGAWRTKGQKWVEPSTEKDVCCKPQLNSLLGFHRACS